MKVSIIIPAHNAAETIAETLESLTAQTHQEWEAIVVDDGSTDQTIGIAGSFAQRDSRIRGISQAKSGVSAARNSGIAAAEYDWLLFLDADDRILPQMLERMTTALVSDPTLDAVHCGSTRVAPDGTLVGEKYWPPSGDLFDTFARRSAFPIHACVVRKSLVEAAGGFDTSLRTCEDWDLWQKISRTGARFGAVPEMLSLYRMQVNSASLDGFQMFADGLRVLRQGHSPDRRVQSPHPDHACGLPIEELPSQEFYCLCWCAGLALGHGKDAKLLLKALKDDRYPLLDPNGVAQNIFHAVPISRGQSPDMWVELWPNLEKRINQFLVALEQQSQASGVARLARNVLQGLILDQSTDQLPLTLGSIHAVRIEVTEPISDVFTHESVERLKCTIEMEGQRIGTLELPVCDGVVPAYIITDAIAADFSWQIIGRFFDRTIYRDLRVEWKPTGFSLSRDTLHLADALSDSNLPFWVQLHDWVGWTIFLQEVWGHPNWPLDRFYDPAFVDEPTPGRQVESGFFFIEVSEDIPSIEVTGQQLQELDIGLKVGGVTIGTVTVTLRANGVLAHELRHALISASGYELCRAVVREALIGKPIVNYPASLRQRLQRSAATQMIPADDKVLEATPNVFFAPDSARALKRVLDAGACGIVICRRADGKIGTSASRRAAFPKTAVAELLDSVLLSGDPVIQLPNLTNIQGPIVYAPELIWRSPESRYTPAKEGSNNGKKQAHRADIYLHDRSHFESIFAADSDPWKYTSAYEQTKFAQSLALLPSIPINRALELACAEGHFTIQLANKVDKLIAADISRIALERASERCSGLENVSFIRLDLTKDPLPGKFDLIVCCEVLYYVEDKQQLHAVATKCADALQPGGHVLMAHANLVVDEPDRTGFDWGLPFGAKVIGETFASISSLSLLKELWTPLYRIQLFRRENGAGHSTPSEITEVIKCEERIELLPEVASQVLWNGGTPWRRDCKQVFLTDRLPILMYHRVSPDGSSGMKRYRVTPDVFEEQLCYLRDASCYSVRLEDWHAAMETKKPLPGRAVIITFDDGYSDFLTYAWPLLKRYGFSASVFLVAGEIGGVNSWDLVFGERVPLLGWKEIALLQEEGVEFGSHSMTHRPLTALSPEEIVREGARSKAILERNLSMRIQTFAYPYGASDRVVEHLIGACGYIYGLSCRPELSRFHDRLLEIPRIEITGSDGLEQFVAKLRA